jgi:pectinesterase
MQKVSRSKQKMKRIFLLLFLTVNFMGAGLVGQGKRVVVKATNPLDLDRPHEMIALKWSDLQKLVRISRSDKICVCDAQTNDTLMTQCIDEDQDGVPEELIFCSHLKPLETKLFVLQVCSTQNKPFQSWTDAQYMVPREDVAWENDRIAFRMYGPVMAKSVNNGIDVWTKRVRYPIVEKWYKGDEAPDSVRVSYHEDHGEGADFFDVGRSLGDGSCGLIDGDSLYQPGVFDSYKILATGPIRAMFEVTYKPVRFKNLEIREIKRITLDVGNNLNKIEVTYQCDSANNTVSFAAGLVKRKDVSLFTDKENGYISLWGPTNDNEKNGALGTGIVMTNKIFNAVKEDNVHVLVLGTVKLNKSIVYYAGAGWTRSGDFHDAEDWNKYLMEFSQHLKSPLEIRMSSKK